MSRIALKIPPNVKMTGALRSRQKVENLLQDMLQLELPGGIVIDVGWYPDWDPNGEYRLIVFRENSADQLLEPEVRTKSVANIQKSIHRCLSKYLQPTVLRFGVGGTSLSLSINGTITITPAPPVKIAQGSVARLVGVLT